MAEKKKTEEEQEQKTEEQVQATPAMITITAEELKSLFGPKSKTANSDNRKLDETIPGGRYKVNGEWRDANGKVLSDQS